PAEKLPTQAAIPSSEHHRGARWRIRQTLSPCDPAGFFIDKRDRIKRTSRDAGLKLPRSSCVVAMPNHPTISHCPAMTAVHELHVMQGGVREAWIFSGFHNPAKQERPDEYYARERLDHWKHPCYRPVNFAWHLRLVSNLKLPRRILVHTRPV